MAFCLLHLGLPADAEAAKSRDASWPIGGAQVAERLVLDRLLRHSSAERVIVVPDPTLSRTEIEARMTDLSRADRVVLAAPDDLPVPEGARVVIFQPTTGIDEGASFRRRWGAGSWPVVGLSHALDGADALRPALLAALCTDLFEPDDTMICTSRAGLVAWDRLQEQLGVGGSHPVNHRIRSRLLPLGTDVDAGPAPDRGAARRSLGLADTDQVFLSVGRICRRTKADLVPLLVSFRAAFGSDRSRRLVIAGDTTGGGGPELHRAIAALGLGDRVLVMADPSTVDKAHLYATADVVVQLGDNLQETFGLSVIQAHARGLPTVVSDWSGFRDLVTDGETGFRVPTVWRSDGGLARLAGFVPERRLAAAFATEVSVDLDELARILRLLAEEPSLRRAMGERARRSVERRFGWDRVIDGYDALFEELARSGRPAPATDGTGWPPDAVAVFGHYATATAPLAGLFAATDDPSLLDAVQRLLPDLAEILQLSPSGRIDPGVVLTEATARGLGRRAVTEALLLAVKYGAIAQVGGGR